MICSVSEDYFIAAPERRYFVTVEIRDSEGRSKLLRGRQIDVLVPFIVTY